MTPADASLRARRAAALASWVAVGLCLLAASLVSAEEARRAVPDALVQKASAEGRVRVIVELGGAGAVPESELSSVTAVAGQRARIAADRASVRAALRGLGHRVLHEFKTIPYMGLEVDPDALRMLGALPGLATRVHEDTLVRPALAQSSPLVKAPDAWAAGWDGTGQVIAILDTGVDKDHPFLAGKVVEEACYSSEGSCPTGSTSSTAPGSAAPCTYAPSECSHGTHVAGIAAGKGASFSGVARGASIMAIQVFSEFTGSFCDDAGEDPCTGSWSSDQVAALERVYELRDTYSFASANLSLGGATTYAAHCDATNPAMAAMIATLRAAGIATVVAAGNAGDVGGISSPACISGAISVGATSDGSGGLAADFVMSFSNSAPILSLLAPGYQITSSVPGGGFAGFGGTSMAAPHVAGAWAIAKQAAPAASVDEVLAGLRSTGRPIFDPGNGRTFPRIAATLLQFSASAYSVNEAAGATTITVTRTGGLFGPAAGAPLTVHYATSADSAVPGQDYTETSGTLQFTAGQTSRTFTIPILNDSINRGPRTVTLTLSQFGGGALPGLRDTATLTIAEDDLPGTIEFAASAYSVRENAGLATIAVTRSGGTVGDITVEYATSDGTARADLDYTAASGTLTFGASGPGATTQTFTVPVIDNAALDGSRTIHLTLSYPGGGATLGSRKTAVLTIADDEIALQLSQASYSVKEGGTATITVTRSGPKERAVDVLYTLLPGSATPGADYGGPATPQLLSFAPNQLTRTFTVPTVNDTLVEGPETVLLQLSGPTNGARLGPRQTAVLTIVDNDAGGAFRFGAPRYSVKESAAAATITVSRSGGTAAASVDVAVIGGTAVAGAQYTVPNALVPDTVMHLTFAAGQATRSFTIVPIDDGAVGPDKTVFLTLENPQGGGAVGSPAAAVVTIVDTSRAGTIQFAAAKYTVKESSPAAVLKITRLGGINQAASVQLSFVDDSGVGGTACAEGVDYAPASNPQTVAFAAGQSTATVSVPVCANAIVNGPRAFTAHLSDPLPATFALGAVPDATVQLVDDESLVQLSSAHFAVGEAAGAASLVITRTGSAAGAVVVSYVAAAAGAGPGFATPAASPAACSAGADFRPVTGTVTLAAGQTSKSFAIPLCGDSVPGEGEEVFTLALTGIVSGPGVLGTPTSASVSILENDGPLVRLGAATYTANEKGGSATITLLRTGPLSSPASVELVATAAESASATGAGSCGDGVDFVASTKTVSFAAGQSSRTATVALCDDPLAEPTKTFDLLLQNPVGVALGTPSTAIVTLTDNDVAGTLRWNAADVSGVEGATLALTVTRSGGAAGDVTVEVTAHDGDGDMPGADGVAGVDYELVTPSPLVFGAGSSSQAVELTLPARAGVQGPRAFRVSLHDPNSGAGLGNPSTITVWVLDAPE